MKQKLYYSIALGVLMFFSVSSKAQGTDPQWTLFAEDGGVKAYYTIGTCDARNVMFLKFENSNKVDVKVNFQMVLENNPPTPQILEIKANDAITGKCLGTPDLVKDVKANFSVLPPFSMNLIN